MYCYALSNDYNQDTFVPDMLLHKLTSSITRVARFKHAGLTMLINLCLNIQHSLLLLRVVNSV